MSYDIIQTVFLLNLASNGASAIQGTQTELTGYLKAYLNGGTSPIGTPYPGFFPSMNPQLAGGDWQVVWGPATVLPPGKAVAYAANAAYIGYSASRACYVVAIAATNPKSIYDWVSEDGDVAYSRMPRWPITLPYQAGWHALPWLLKPAVSSATATGVNSVLTLLKDPLTGLGIQDFLQNLVQSGAAAKATLVFSGHSLAGALSPSVADFIYPEPKNSGWQNVFVLPTAGATPGNGKFAADWIRAYPPTSAQLPGNPAYGTWNVDHVNNHDVVPHAWNKLKDITPQPDGHGKFKFIFGTLDPAMGTALRDAVMAADTLALGGDYTNLSQAWFDPDWGCWQWTQNADGTYQYPPAWVSAPSYTDASPLQTLPQLGGMIEVTHIDQYFKYFNVLPPPRFPLSLPATDVVPSALRTALLAAAKVSA